MHGLTLASAAAHRKDNVRVNAIAVGSVDTPLRRTSVPGEYKSTPHMLQREGDAWDIAKAALFLASDDAAHITAVVLAVDAGATAKSA